MLITLISRLFDPLIMLGTITVIGAWKSGMTASSLELFLLVMFLGMICLPLSLLAWAIHTKRVGNWDVSDRRQRIRVLTAFIPFLFLDFFLVYYFGILYLLRLYVVFALWFIGFYSITLFWKISGHSSGTALATAFMIRWFSWSWWPILAIVPLIAWIRVKQKNHSPAQTVLGALYSWTVFFVCMSLGLA